MRILRIVQNLCLDELKINWYELEKGYTNYAEGCGRRWAGIFYLEEGEVHVYTKTDTFVLHPGDLCFLPQGLKHYTISYGRPHVKFFDLAFSFRTMHDTTFDQSFPCIKLKTIRGEQARDRLQYIFGRFNGSDQEKLLAISEFYRLFSDIIGEIQSESKETIHPVVKKAMNFIEEHCLEDFSMADLANHCLISESRLYHLFQKELHRTPVSYKNRLRIKKAFALLNQTNLPIEEIAEKLNFHSTVHFRKVFREDTATTPTQYRKTFTVGDKQYDK